MAELSWQESMNRAFAAVHCGMQAAQQAQVYGVGIVIRDEDGNYSNPEPHTYKLVRPGEDEEEKEVDHGQVVMYRVVLMDHEPSYVPPCDYSESVAQEASLVQAIYEDGFIAVVKNRFGVESSG